MTRPGSSSEAETFVSGTQGPTILRLDLYVEKEKENRAESSFVNLELPKDKPGPNIGN